MSSNTEVLLTQKQLEHRLDVTPMTVYNWRYPDYRPEHNSGDTPPLPTIVTPKGTRNQILFSLTEVTEWLRQYRPALLGKIRSDRCGCKHCRTARLRTKISSRDQGSVAIPQSA